VPVYWLQHAAWMLWSGFPLQSGLSDADISFLQHHICQVYQGIPCLP